jgi:uncharacterized protein YdiU (UPF0061 family)
MDVYNPHYICNHSDDEGRYSFKNQPQVGLWNLSRFVSSLAPLLSTDPEAEVVTQRLISSLENYKPRLEFTYRNLMCAKFGIESTVDNLKHIVQPFLTIMYEHKMDYTLTMRSLSKIKIISEIELLKLWKSYSSNQAETSNFNSECSEWIKAVLKKAVDTDSMDMVNPKFILRNHILQDVIEQAQNGNYSGVLSYLAVLQNPFSDATNDETRRFSGVVPLNLQEMRCSCSS